MSKVTTGWGHAVWNQMSQVTTGWGHAIRNRVSQVATGWNPAVWNRMTTPYKDYNRTYSFLQTHTYVTHCQNKVEFKLCFLLSVIRMLKLLPYNLLPPCNNVTTSARILPVSYSKAKHHVVFWRHVCQNQSTADKHATHTSPLLHLPSINSTQNGGTLIKYLYPVETTSSVVFFTTVYIHPRTRSVCPFSSFGASYALFLILGPTAHFFKFLARGFCPCCRVLGFRLFSWAFLQSDILHALHTLMKLNKELWQDPAQGQLYYSRYLMT
jgi:hypothetical protein